MALFLVVCGVRAWSNMFALHPNILVNFKCSSWKGIYVLALFLFYLFVFLFRFFLLLGKSSVHEVHATCESP